LPSTIAITPKYGNESQLLESVERYPSEAAAWILLRQPQWPVEDYLPVVSRLRERFPELKLLYHGDPEQFNQLTTGHVHMPAYVAMAKHDLADMKHFTFSMSCHNHEELAHAQRLGVEFVTLSPVRHTGSHPNTQPLGWDRFKALSETVSMPVYALGGVIPSDLTLARAHGAHGVAGISGWQNFVSD